MGLLTKANLVTTNIRDNGTNIKSVINNIYGLTTNLNKKYLIQSVDVTDIKINLGSIEYNPSKLLTIEEERRIALDVVLDIYKNKYIMTDLWTLFSENKVLNKFKSVDMLRNKENYSISLDILIRNNTFIYLLDKYFTILAIYDMFSSAPKEILNKYNITEYDYTNILNTHLLQQNELKKNIIPYYYNIEDNKDYITRGIYEIGKFCIQSSKDDLYLEIPMKDTSIILSLGEQDIIDINKKSKGELNHIIESEGTHPNQNYSNDVNIAKLGFIKSTENDDNELNSGKAYNSKTKKVKVVDENIKVKVDLKYLNNIRNHLRTFKSSSRYSFMTPDIALLQYDKIIPSNPATRFLNNLDEFNIYVDTSVSMKTSDLEVALSVAMTVKTFYKNVNVNEFNSFITEHTLKSFQNNMYNIKARGGTNIQSVMKHIEQHAKVGVSLIITDGELEWELVKKFVNNYNYKLIFVITGDNYSKIIKDNKLFSKNIILIRP